MAIALHFIRDDGSRIEAMGQPGQSLMRAAIDAGIDEIKADCGGILSCATCHVFVADDWMARLPPASTDEEAMLEMTAAPRRRGSRLGCQIALDASLDGLTVSLPETQY